jgi:predicted Zn-dependent protease
MNQRFYTLFLIPLSASLLLLFGCVRNPATRKVHARLLSAESEKKIGLETKKRILEEYQVFKSTPVTEYVNRVGQKLAAVSDRPTVDYDFTVLDSDLINAFAVPGGYLFVTRGLLDNIDDEAELAMVLGHEIAHVAALHGVQMIQKEMGQNALSLLGTIGAALVAGPEAMLMVANTADLFSSLYLLGYSRDKELEADNLGLQYLMRAGYDPQASLRFLKQLESGDDDKKLRGWDLYFRTHPATTDRINIIQHMIGPGTDNAKTSYKKEYQEIKAMLPTIDPTERGEISGLAYTNPIHRLSISVPKNWTLGFYHPQSLVSFRTLDNKGEGRIQSIKLSSTTMTAENLAFEYSKAAGFQFVSGRDVLYRAGYGYLGRYLGVSAAGKPLDIKMFTTLHYNHGYVLLCGAPMDHLESYLLDIEQIMREFKFDYF